MTDQANYRGQYGMTDKAAMAYLLEDGGAVPCSRYGTDSESCAPIALEIARIVADSSGDGITRESLDGAMSLVVNDSDEPLTLILEHGDSSVLPAQAIGEHFEDAAREIGKNAARSAAQWIVDGNTERATAAKMLEQLRDGDPSSDEWMPRINLSGEFADDWTPRSLAETVGYRGEDGNVLEAICEAFEDGVSDWLEDACESELIMFLGE